MKNLEKLKEIRDILADTYDGSLSSDRMDELADEIYDYAYMPGYDLADIILALTFDDEETETANNMDEWDKQENAMNVFYAVVDCMENNELTAKKLYDCFIENFTDSEVFCKLMNWNDEWLSPKQMKTLKEAAQVFDKEFLKEWNWDDEE